MSGHDPSDDDQITDAFSVQVISGQVATRPTPYLQVVGGKMPLGTTFRLRGEHVLGRAKEADIRLEDAGISREHARVSVRDWGEIELWDLDSKNGTFCNAERVTRRVLQPGDVIQLGPTAMLKFVLREEVVLSAESQPAPTAGPPSSSRAPAAPATPRPSRERRGGARLAVPLNARLVTAAGETEHEVRDVSRSGIFLYTREPPPKVGTKVTLKLAITAGIKPVTLAAEVARAVLAQGPEKVQGMGLRFGPIDAAQRAQLIDLLDRAMTGHGTRGRAFPRLTALLPVRLEAEESFPATTRDIGEGGLGLVVDRELPLDRELQITLERGGGSPPLVVKGWVVWREQLSREAGSWMIGVRFMRLAPEVRAEIQALLKNLYMR